jgi:hypothetical protein
MEQLSNYAAIYIAHALVSSFSLLQDSPDIDAFIDSVLEAMPLSNEQRLVLTKSLHSQSTQFTRPGMTCFLPYPFSFHHSISFLFSLYVYLLLIGKYEIARIAVTDLLPAIDYPVFLKLLETSPEGADIAATMKQYVFFEKNFVFNINKILYIKYITIKFSFSSWGANL